MSDSLTSTNLLASVQKTNGRRQKLLLSLLQLQLLIESGSNLNDDQKAILGNVIVQLDTLVPAKPAAQE